MDWPQDNDRRLAVVSVETSASPEQVWRALADVPRWPSWYPDLSEARGVLSPGGTLRLRFRGVPWRGGGAVDAVVDEVVPPRSVTFRARRAGLPGFYTFRVAAQAGPGCRLSASAFLSGLRLPWISARFGASLEREQLRALRGLARISEGAAL